MFDIITGRGSDCAGVNRRDMIRIGALGWLGLSLPDFLRMRSADAAPGGPAPAGTPEINCIMIWLSGGPPQHETFDPKPNAPPEIRGEFGVTRARTGEQFSALVPRLAKVADRFSVIRTVTHADGNHETARAQLQSGYKFNPALAYPSFGSVTAREKGPRNGLPPYVLFAGRPEAEGAGYLGSVYNPLAVPGDPSTPDFSVQNVVPPAAVQAERFDRRQKILASLDQFQRQAEVRAPVAASMDRFFEQAFTLVTSPTAKKAFAVQEEPETLRERYGRHRLGQSCLLARRLVESGVRFVTITMTGWDTHRDHFQQVKGTLVPPLDQAYSALLEDLGDRGMLANTLVLCMGEFGRTPRINPAAGRDHWPSAFSVALGGGPVKLGRVVGATDGTASLPAERPVRVPDLAATIYQALGIDHTKEYMTPQGRPLQIVSQGVPVSELF